MTKPRDAAHESEAGDEKLDPASAKQVDLHRYQVMTIPMELQQELASLKAPRLSDDELKPLPPIEEVVKARQGTSSNPPAAGAKVRRARRQYEIVLIGVALILVLGWLFRFLATPDPRDRQKAAEPTPAQQPPTPVVNQQVPAQPSPPADALSVANATPATRASEEPVVKAAASHPHSVPVQATPSTKATSPETLSAGASPPIESTNKPKKRAAFKPE